MALNCHSLVDKHKEKILNSQERKREYDLREIWNAIFKLLKRRCQWHILSSNVALWELVYYYYRKWHFLFEVDLLLNKLHKKVHIKIEQKAEDSLRIINSQSVHWGNNHFLNGINGNKKVKGDKRHVVVDKKNFLLAVMSTIACLHDSKAAYLLVRYLRQF